MQRRFSNPPSSPVQEGNENDDLREFIKFVLEDQEKESRKGIRHEINLSLFPIQNTFRHLGGSWLRHCVDFLACIYCIAALSWIIIIIKYFSHL